jgi:hypothetical protein
MAGFAPAPFLQGACYHELRTIVLLARNSVQLGQSTASPEFLLPVSRARDVSFQREKTVFNQRFPHPDDVWIVHRQDNDCHTADGSLANHVRAIPLEVSSPLVPSRVE